MTLSYECGLAGVVRDSLRDFVSLVIMEAPSPSKLRIGGSLCRCGGSYRAGPIQETGSNAVDDFARFLRSKFFLFSDFPFIVCYPPAPSLVLAA